MPVLRHKRARLGPGPGPRPVPSPAAAALRAARLAAGLTQGQVAAAGGFTRGWVGQMEIGHRNPTLDSIVVFCRAIGCDPHAIDPRLASTAAGGAADGDR